MKKFLIIIISIIAALSVLDYSYYRSGKLYLKNHDPVTYFSQAQGEHLYLDQGDGFEVFDLRGVNMGLGKPGHYATEFSLSKEEYLRWFSQIQDMGANVIRTYIIAYPEFYEAFYEYNINNPNPLYLIHGVWIDDYLINSSYGALDKEFYDPFLRECKSTVDVIHGRYKAHDDHALFSNVYNKDISPWVYGYIMGVEWENNLVGYTDFYFDQLSQYHGKYLYTEGGSNFEIFLAAIGDQVIKYETEKYGTQRVMAFSNWATTDPLDYPDLVAKYFKKFNSVDVEHIKCTENFKPGQFASYHIYPYYPDYYSAFALHEENTYLQYLKKINEHHTMPVVISEFGVPSSRGMAATELANGRNQGFMSEREQGEAIVSAYEDIIDAGSAGAIVFTWQDEWFKRTWNTMANVDLEATPYWSDYQTNEQYFGLMSFDPGEEESVCYVDGDKTEWTEDDRLVQQDDFQLSMKRDEKFVYFLIEAQNDKIYYDKIYIPIDVTPKSGSNRSADPDVSMDNNADFLVILDGRSNSRILVQERYDTVMALQSSFIVPEQAIWEYVPEMNSSKFQPIYLLIQKDLYFEKVEPINGVQQPDRQISLFDFDPHNRDQYSIMESYETGKLCYGNANPESPQFNSLADYCTGNGIIELKLPWQLLNFADPSSMKIHDDYYEVYGVEYLTIDSIKVGVGDGTETIHMAPYELEPLGRHPEYHERLKQSYYILQDYWAKN